MYIGWYDPDKKTTTSDKLTEAVARYRAKWGREPRVALVNVADVLALRDYPPPLDIRAVGHVAPNTFLVGEDEPS